MVEGIASLGLEDAHWSLSRYYMHSDILSRYIYHIMLPAYKVDETRKNRELSHVL